MNHNIHGVIASKTHTNTPNSTHSCRFLDDVWNSVLQLLSIEFGEDISKHWFLRLALFQSTDTKIYLLAPTRFLRDWINTYYIDQVRKIASKIHTELALLRIHTIGDNIFTSEDLVFLQNSDFFTEKSSSAFEENSASISEENYDSGMQDSNDSNTAFQVYSNLDEKYSFDRFIIGKTNEFAYAAARRVAENICTYNPLFFCGDVGLGKTHLMHAVGLFARAKYGKKIVYTTAESFMYEFIKSIRYKTTIEFKKLFREIDILMIDDIQFISGKSSTQEEFFHTLNTLIDQNKQVIISADKFPSELNGITDRIRSRLSSGLVANVEHSDYELRLAILQSKVEDKGITAESGVLEMLAERIDSNIRELDGALTTITVKAGDKICLRDAESFFEARSITFARAIDPEQIKNSVAEYYNITISDINGKKRTSEIARARQVAMFLIKSMTTLSLPSIGKLFDGRDHTTVLHAVRNIGAKIAKSEDLTNDLTALKKKLR
jgi:chromosomal replication initiator protein